jgi:hypothetical protein
LKTAAAAVAAEPAGCSLHSVQAEHLTEISKMDLSNIKGIKTTVV